MKYIIENTDKLDDEFLNSSISKLSLQRLRRMDELRTRSDKINCAAAYLLLRYALRKEYGITDAPDFRFGKNGKPYLCSRDDIFFNLSHSRNSCACIIDTKETACDIADIRHISDNTARYFCSEEEFSKICTSENKNYELVKLWCIKECRAKLYGRGLAESFKKLTKGELQGITVYEGERYVSSFFGEGKPVILGIEDII